MTTPSLRISAPHVSSGSPLRTCIVLCLLFTTAATAAVKTTPSHKAIRTTGSAARRIAEGILSSSNLDFEHARVEAYDLWRHLSSRQIDGPEELRRVTLRDAANPKATIAPSPAVDARALTPVPTQFDSVFESGTYGNRLHVYTYEQGLLVLRRTLFSTGNAWEEEQRITSTYTPLGQLESRACSVMGLTSPYAIESNSYDTKGRRSSHRHASIDWDTGFLTTTWFDTTAFDDQDRLIYDHFEARNIPDAAFGYEQVVSYTNTSEVRTVSILDRGEWIPNCMLFSTYGPTRSTDSCLILAWNDRWVISSLRITTYNSGMIPVREDLYRWEGETWVQRRRTTYSVDARGLTTSMLTESRIDTEWVPEWRFDVAFDATGRTILSTNMDWHDRWVMSSKYTTAYGADGSVATTDSSWVEGSLSYISADSTDAAGRTLFSMGIGDYRDPNPYGLSTRSTYTPTGRQHEVISGVYCDGAWHPDERYLFGYDPSDRIHSLQRFARHADDWVQTSDRNVWNGGSWGGYWQFDDPSDASWCFSDFSALTFIYRDAVNSVTSDAGGSPTTSALAQNYPNPFNPTTTIPFSVATGVRTIVAIFDVLGREVARPVDAWKDPGEYRVEFDAKGLASGMYICRFTSGSVSQTRKLMLVR